MSRLHLPFALALAVTPALAHAKAPPKEVPAQKPAAGSLEKFGGPVGPGKALTVAELVAKPDELNGKTVIVEGRVRAACARKGCWMELAPSAEKGAQGCRVTFKDYGFFVPKDSAGASARVEGVVAVKTLDQGQVEHYESEGASLKKDKDGTAKEIRIVAVGVELKR